ncbi:MAG: M20 family metallopeptidase [Chloroflexi bacterium]|nr:M20 family metallopeptidase [Chloroflexota bacterium]
MADPLSYIREDEALAILLALVRAGGVNPPGETANVIRELAEHLDADGIPYEVLPARPRVDSLVATLAGQRPGKTLLLNGHVDVVPPGANWTMDPFVGVFRDGRVYGRGACDMKAGVAAMLLAQLALRRAGAPFAGHLVFTAVADEETGGELGTRFLLQRGLKADYAVIGEPSNLRVELGNRGLAWFRIAVRGKAGHPGRPATGVNAVAYAGKLVSAIADMKFSGRNELFEVPTPSITVTMIQGGVKANVIPDDCVVTCDRRLLPGETTGGALAELESVIADLPQPGITATVSTLHAMEAYVVSQDEPVVRALAGAHARVLGAPPQYGAKGGGTDGSFLYHEGGIPTVLYGPGNVELAHTADEYVDLAGVVAAAKVYTLLALDLLAVDQG